MVKRVEFCRVAPQLALLGIMISLLSACDPSTATSKTPSDPALPTSPSELEPLIPSAQPTPTNTFSEITDLFDHLGNNTRQQMKALYLISLRITNDSLESRLTPEQQKILENRVEELRVPIRAEKLTSIEKVYKDVTQVDILEASDETKIAHLIAEIEESNQNQLFSAQSPVNEWLAQVKKMSKKRLAYRNEPLFPVCENNQHTQLWGQFLLASDLTQAQLKEWGITTKNIKVAVIDSGFDRKGNAENIDTSDFQTDYSGPYKEMGDEGRDENGHGTAVSGTIVGKNGIGVAPGVQLKVFRVTSAGTTGKTGSSRIDDAIKKACREGYSTINVSWGDSRDERGAEREEISKKEMFNSLWEKGCIVVKSAGNDSYRNYAPTPLEDNLLRVASVSTYGGLSGFSTKGEVHAPGSHIFSLRSSESEVKPENTCFIKGKRVDGAFISGTSFSAPYVAGVIALVRAVLESDQEFSHLSLPKQVILINQIIKASEFGGAVSALRAVLIAKAWNENPNSNASYADLRELLRGRPPQFCRQSLDSCVVAENNGSTDACVNHYRKLLLACNHSDKVQAARSLIETLNNYRNNDLSVVWIHAATQAYKLPAQELEKEIRMAVRLQIKQWHESRSYSTKTPYYRWMEILPLFIRISKNDADRTLAKQMMQIIFESDEFFEVLNKKDQRGSEEELVKVVTLLKYLKEHFGEDSAKSALQLISKAVEKRAQRYGSVSLGPYVPLLRIITTLSNPNDPTIALLRPLALEAETKVMERLIASNVQIPTWFAREQTNDLLIAFGFSDVRDIQIQDFYPAVQRQRDQFLELYKKIVDGTVPMNKVGTFPLAFIINQDGQFDDALRFKVILRVLEVMTSGKGWSANDELLNQIQTRISALAERFSFSAPFRGFEKQMVGILENSNHLTLNAKFIDFLLKMGEKRTVYKLTLQMLRSLIDQMSAPTDKTVTLAKGVLDKVEKVIAFNQEEKMKPAQVVYVKGTKGSGTFDDPLLFTVIKDSTPRKLPDLYIEFFVELLKTLLKGYQQKADLKHEADMLFQIHLNAISSSVNELLDDRRNQWEPHYRVLIDAFESSGYETKYFTSEKIKWLKFIEGKANEARERQKLRDSIR